MREIWNRKAGEFEGEMKKASDVTGEYFELSQEQKDAPLKELLKTDRARFRAFLSILKKMKDMPDQAGEMQGTVEASEIGKEQDSAVDGEESSRLSKSYEAQRQVFAKEVKVFRILEAVESFIEGYKKGEHSTLEPRQVESLSKIAAFLRSDSKGGYLELPTGIGKTVIFSELIEALQDVPGIKILVVGSGNINAIQNVQKIERFGGEDVGQYFGPHKNLEAKVTVCNYHGLRNGIQGGNIKEGDFDLVILDEVHDGLGEVTQETMQEALGNSTLLGFSATATYELSRGRSVANFLPVEIDKMGTVEAVRKNLLSAFRVEVLKLPTTVKGVTVRGGDYFASELEKQINTEERNDFIVDSYIDYYRKEGDMAIAFCVQRQHAKDLASRFERKGIKAGVLTGELSIDEREAVLKKWKDGEIEMLCGSKLAWQSLDETEACIGLNAAPSMSPKDVIQRGGRLMRRSTARNNKRATIVEYFDDWRESKNRPIFYSEIIQSAGEQPDNWKKEEKELGGEEEEVQNVKADEQSTFEAGADLPDISDLAGPEAGSVSVQVPESVSEEESTADTKEKGKKSLVRYVDKDWIMALSNQNRKFRNEGYYEDAPKKWMSANIIALELGISQRDVGTAIIDVATEISTRKFDINSGTYLSALGIKRTFYGPEFIDLVYKQLTGSSRSERVLKGELEDVEISATQEEQSIQKEQELERIRKPDLEWQDYDMTPTFTLQGESLDEENEGTNIYDTAELHGPNEPVQGEHDDLTGYRYLAIDGKVNNYKIPNKSTKFERKMKITERYGLKPEKDIAQPIEMRESYEEREMLGIITEIMDSDKVLTPAEKDAIQKFYFNDGLEDVTQKSISKEVGLGLNSVSQLLMRAIRKIRHQIGRKYENPNARFFEE